MNEVLHYIIRHNHNIIAYCFNNNESMCTCVHFTTGEINTSAKKYTSFLYTTCMIFLYMIYIYIHKFIEIYIVSCFVSSVCPHLPLPV